MSKQNVIEQDADAARGGAGRFAFWVPDLVATSAALALALRAVQASDGKDAGALDALAAAYAETGQFNAAILTTLRAPGRSAALHASATPTQMRPRSCPGTTSGCTRPP